jgi:hypothetical protein
LQSSCEDIRFTDSDETTLIDYWIESGCNTASTKIWVEVPSIAASSSETIYMYYGNAFSAAGSNPDETLDTYATFQSDWEGFSLQTSYGYGYWRDTGQGNPSPSARILEGSGCRLCAPSAFCDLEGAIYKVLSKPSDVGYCVTLDYRAQSDYSSSGVTNFRLGFVNPSSNSCLYNSYFVKGGTYDTGWKYNQTKCTTNVQGYSSVRILLGMHDAWSTDWNEQAHIDNVRVRKYSSPEPTASAGTEETVSYVSGEQNWIKDSSGNDNHGTPTGTTYIDDGKLGGARDFNGSSDYIGLPASADFDVQNLTIDSWVYSDNFVRDMFIFEKTTNGSVNTQYSCFFSSSNIFYFRTYNSSGTSDNLSFTTSDYFQNDSWNHVACVYDGSEKMVYVNGSLVVSKAYSQTLMTNPNGTSIIGAYGSGTSYFFNGSIDEVRVSDIARSADEIKRLYQIGYEQKIQGAHTSASIDMGNSSAEVENISWTSVGDDTGDGELPYSTTGLVGQWNFNESSGTTAINEGSCGSSCNGTLTNFSNTSGQDVVTGSGWTSDNRRWGEGGLMFDGVDDYVEVPDDLDLHLSNDFTISTWVKRSQDNDTWERIITKSNSTGIDLWMQVIANDTVECGLYKDDGNPYYYTSTAKVPVGEWAHVACTLDSSNNWRLYVNGVESEGSTTGIVGSARTSTKNLQIGRLVTSTSTYYDFTGSLDAIQIYSRALSQTEILSNYQSGNIEMRYRTSDDGSTWSDWYGGTEESVEGFNNEYLYDTDDSGLVAYYPMDEDSGSTVEDVSNNTNNGTASSTTIVDGKHGNSRYFDGVDDYVTLPSGFSNFTSGFSVELWANPTSNGSYERFIDFGEVSGSGNRNIIFARIGTTNNLGLWAGDGSTVPNLTATDGIINNEWHHYAGTIDASGMGRIYRDGKLLTSGQLVVPQNASRTYNYIGRSNWAGDAYFSGQMDEVKIYDQVLTSTEIHNLWLEGSSNPSIVRTESISNSIEGDNSLSIESNGSSIDGNTVGYWKLDEASGTGAYLLDSSGNDNHGTPTGTTYVKDGKVERARDFNGTSDYISLPTSSMPSGNEVTISFWSYGDPDLQPVDNSVFEAADNSGNRTCNIHLPWSNGNVYWDCGNSGSSYNRIYKPVSSSVYEGRWTHWAFTKNANEGTLKIYVNGELWHAGGNFTYPINTGGNVVIGASRNYGSNYPGMIDEFRIDSVERSADEILGYYNMGKDTHLSISTDELDSSSNTTLPFWIASDEIGSNIDLMYGESEYANYEPDENTVGYWDMDNDREQVYYDTFLSNTTSSYSWTRTDSNSPTNSHAWDSGNEWLEIRTGDNDTENMSFNVGKMGTSGYAKIIFIKRADYPYDNSQYFRIAQDGDNYYRYHWQGSSYSGQKVLKVVGGSVVDESSSIAGTVNSNGAQYTIEMFWSPNNVKMVINGSVSREINTSNNTEINPSSIYFWSNQIDFDLKSIEIRTNGIKDNSGNNNDAVPVGTTVKEGIMGDARSFNGTSDYVSVPRDSFPVDGAFTFSGWFNNISFTGSANIIVSGYESDKSNWFTLQINDVSTEEGDLWIAMRDNAGTGYKINTTSSNSGYYFPYNEWVHLVFTWDGTTTTDAVKLYANGELVHTATSTQSASSTNATGDYTIGAHTNDTHYFYGGIDEVRVSDIARTPDEIRQAYEVGRRTHPIKVDFKADLQSSNLITGDSDTSFSISEQDYGTSDHIENIDVGEKIIVKENIDGTEYIAQANLATVNTSTGAVTVSSWDIGSTFPTSGFTANATVFKWQREYIDVRSPLDEDINQVNRLTFRKTTDVPAIFWIDDMKKATYMEDGNIGNTEEQILGFNDDTTNRDSILKMEGDRSLSLSDTEVYSKNTFTSNDISGYDKLPFWIASDQKGYQTSLLLDGSTDYANYIPDANTVGYWKMDEDVDSIVPDDANLEAYWDFSESSGTGAYLTDKSGNGNDGTPNGTTYTDGVITGGREFDGVDDYIGINNGPDVGVNFTISHWLRVDGYAGSSCNVFLAKGPKDTGHYEVYRCDGPVGLDKYGFYAPDIGDYKSDYEIPEGEWHFYTVTYDSSLGSLKFYIDGQLNKEYTGVSGAIISESEELRVGSLLDNTFHTDGAIDEVGIYSRALSGTEVEEMYNDGREIKDFSGGDNHGIPNGTTYTDGVITGGREFDGVDDYIGINNGPDVGVNFTISHWLRVDGYAGSSCNVFLAKGPKDTGHYEVYRCDGPVGLDKYGFYAPDIGDYKSDYEIPEGEWHFYTVTYDSSLGSLKFYIDGQLNKEYTGVSGAIISESEELRVGSLLDNTFHTDGSIDEVRISNIARSATEIYEAYNIGKRMLQPEIKFKADLQSSNLIADSNDTSFDISEITYGTTNNIENLESGDKIIITEDTYKAQGTVDTVNTSTGAVTVSTWDSGSTFPSGGYTTSAKVFKWQKEYLYTSQVDEEYLTSLDQITMITSGQANVWYDDVRVGEELAYIENAQYIQYQPIFTRWDDNPLLDLYLTEVDITYTAGPTMDQVMRHGKWFDSSGEKQPFWWVGEN